MTYEQSIKEKVLEKIKAEKVSMTPRMYFTVKVIMLSFVVLLVLFITSFLISFILFSIRVSGRMSLLGFGGQGIRTFFALFPWTFFAIDLALLALLEICLKRFRFGYRSPFVYLSGSIVVVSVALALIMDSTHVHPFIEKRIGHEATPTPGNFYIHVRRPPHERGIFKGIVASTSDHMFLLQYNDLDSENDDGMRVVYLPENFPIEKLPHVGDALFVAGEVSGDDIRAFGFKIIQNNED